MRFVDEAHREFYENSDTSDVYHRAFFYTIGMCPTTRRNADRLYNSAGHSINTEALYEGWQTGTSVRVTRLAFNLYCDGAPTGKRYDENGCDLPVTEEDRQETERYSVSDIFCCEYAVFFFEAIKLRYPEYTAR